MAKMQGCLVIVPCGRQKVWSREPDRGATRAADAYTGGPFTVNRRYAERFGDEWVILSAKYGFIKPDFEIPGPYDTTFIQKHSNPVDTDVLYHQVKVLGLDRYARIVGLGGKTYREAIQAAFAPLGLQPTFPFAGLPIGRMLQATKQAIEIGDPGHVRQVN